MRTLTVTLPDELVEEIEARVSSGEYASESDVVWDRLERSLADDPEVEGWLRDVVAPRCRNRVIEPTRLIPAEDVMDRIRHRFAAKRR